MPVMTIREAVSQALWEEMERDDRVLIMGEEVGLWGGTYAVTQAEIDATETDAEQQIVDAVKFAEESPLPPPEELWKDIYVDA